jgi:hypothetical protein
VDPIIRNAGVKRGLCLQVLASMQNTSLFIYNYKNGKAIKIIALKHDHLKNGRTSKCMPI